LNKFSANLLSFVGIYQRGGRLADDSKITSKPQNDSGRVYVVEYSNYLKTFR